MVDCMRKATGVGMAFTRPHLWLFLKVTNCTVRLPNFRIDRLLLPHLQAVHPFRLRLSRLLVWESRGDLLRSEIEGRQEVLVVISDRLLTILPRRCNGRKTSKKPFHNCKSV